MRGIGLNLRLNSNILELVDEAISLNVEYFQCFLTYKQTGRYIQVSFSDIEQFLIKKGSLRVFTHGSYRINLATDLKQYDNCFLFKKELELTQALQAEYLVMHPGSIAKTQTKEQGIDNVVRKINKVMKYDWAPKLLLENVAFGNRAIGGDLQELQYIKEKVDKPEKLFFCIDTSHAFAYGYNIIGLNNQEHFINYMHQTIGLESVKLIHLNDTDQRLGSQHDRHVIPGSGVIGINELKNFVYHPYLQNIPALMEPPCLPYDELKQLVNLFKISE